MTVDFKSTLLKTPRLIDEGSLVHQGFPLCSFDGYKELRTMVWDSGIHDNYGITKILPEAEHKTKGTPVFTVLAWKG